jgi:hypothetical protein
MSRSVAFALILWLANTSAATAGEGLLDSVSRFAREAARAQALAPTTAVAASVAVSVAPRRGTLALAQGQAGLASSGMSRRKKALIWLAAGVGFAATAYTIDHKVVDNTLSSLGTRKD